MKSNFNLNFKQSINPKNFEILQCEGFPSEL